MDVDITDNNNRDMAYYKHENYFSEKEMTGWSEERKAGQRELNWDLRLEHYAVRNPGMFVKMTDEWAAGFKCVGVPTMKMLYILKLARQNGIASNTVLRFCSAEEHLLEQRPNFSSPASVPFNGATYSANCRAAVPGMMPASSTARAAAKLKREKKASAVLARAAGKTAAAEKRAAEETAFAEVMALERTALEKKIASTRKAMGVRKNEENPASLCRLIGEWESEMMLRMYAARK